MKMSDPPKLVKGYAWIVYHPDLLGGKPTVKGTRISVAQVLECLAAGMTPREIADDYPGFPKEAVPDVLRYAAEQARKPLSKSGVAA